MYYPWGLLLMVAAIIHFVRRRPEGYWLWVIIVLGPLGAIIYIVMEVLPDFGLLRQSFEVFPRRKRIRALEAAILDNPSVGNFEELGDLYLDDQKFARAQECYDRAIALRGHSDDARYRRGIAKLELGDFAGAVPDLEHVTGADPKYDRHRAAGLLAHAYANAGQAEQADELFRTVTQLSTQSETYYNYASFLASQQRLDEARTWAQTLLSKKPTMPRYLRRRERPWFRKAVALIKRLKAQSR
jgi:hypothetical protein